MKQRLNHGLLAADFNRKIGEIGMSFESKIGEEIFSLIHTRTSQLNGCTFCLDMDVKKTKLRGDSLLKLFHVSAWRDSQLFSEKERAALEFAEAVTELSREGVSDELFGRMRNHFSEQEIVDITAAIAIVNVWNRMNVAFRTTPGQLDRIFGLDKAGL